LVQIWQDPEIGPPEYLGINNFEFVALCIY